MEFQMMQQWDIQKENGDGPFAGQRSTFVRADRHRQQPRGFDEQQNRFLMEKCVKRRCEEPLRFDLLHEVQFDVWTVIVLR
jgi:hypothetical protein